MNVLYLIHSLFDSGLIYKCEGGFYSAVQNFADEIRTFGSIEKFTDWRAGKMLLWGNIRLVSISGI
jgi:hypothetical protein